MYFHCLRDSKAVTFLAFLQDRKMSRAATSRDEYIGSDAQLAAAAYAEQDVVRHCRCLVFPLPSWLRQRI